MQLLLGREADVVDIRGVLHSTPSTSSFPRTDDLDQAVRRVVQAQATGILLVEGDQQSGSLHFEAGRICFALTGDDLLGEPPGVDASEAAEIVDDVIACLRSNESVAVEFRTGPVPLHGGIALAADHWFDLGEPEPFTVYRLTRIA